MRVRAGVWVRVSTGVVNGIFGGLRYILCHINCYGALSPTAVTLH